MSVRRGESWGVSRPLPDDGVVVHSDAEARRVVTEALEAGRPVPPLGLLGGDLCRTVGGTGDAVRLGSPEAMTLPVDLGWVDIDGRRRWFVAHLVARRRLWIGRSVVVMNAQWLGSWDLGPRSHPGDGLLDVTDGDLPWDDRLQARRRARTGTHVPHPSLATSRVRSLDLALGRRMTIWLDGERVGRTGHLTIGVEPDALRVVV